MATIQDKKSAAKADSSLAETLSLHARGGQGEYHDSTITPSFIENNKIVSEDSPEAEKLAGLMQQLAERLLGKNYDPAKHQFRFLFSALPVPNGGIITRAKPPIVVTRTSLITGAKSIDEIAGYLAHELGHLYIQEQFGSERKRNSKAEEEIADLYSMKLLLEAGFNPLGLEALISRIGAKKEPALSALLDVHPLDQTRLSIFAKTKIVLAREGYNISQPLQPVPSEWEIAARLSYASPIEQEAQIKGYESMPPEEKLRWIRTEAETLRAERERSKARFGRGTISESILKSRQATLNKLYAEVRIDRKSAAQRDAVLETFHTLLRLDMMQGAETFYKVTLQKLNGSVGEKPWPLIGKLEELDGYVTAFLGAKTLAEAQETAIQLSQCYYQTGIDHLYQDSNPEKFNKYSYQHVKFHSFRLPSLISLENEIKSGPVELSLSNHLRWLQQSQSKDIAQALALLGGKSFFNARAYYLSLSTDIISPILISGEEDKSQNLDAYQSSILINKDSKVSAVLRKIERPQTRLAGSKNQTEAEGFKEFWRYDTKQRVQWERGLLKNGVHWDLLESNPERFIFIYEDAFHIRESFEPEEYPFAEAVTEKIRELCKKDIDTARAVAKIVLQKCVAVGISKIPPELKGRLRMGVDPNHPFVNLSLSFTQPPLRFWDFAREASTCIDNHLIARVRYTDVFERNAPLDESHLHLTRKMLGCERSIVNYPSLRNIISEFRATEIARRIQESSGSLNLGTALSFNDSIANLPDENTLKSWLKSSIKPPLHDAVLKFKDQSLEEQIYGFRHLDKERLFLNAMEIRNELLESILMQIGVLPNPQARADAALKLLYENVAFGQRYCHLSLPAHRERVSGFIAEGMKDKHGVDDGSAEYASRIIPEVNQLFAKTPGLMRLQIVADICRETNSQVAVSHHVREKLARESFLDLAGNEAAFRIGEFIKTYSEDDNELRQAVRAFLSNAYDPARADAIFRIIEAKWRKESEKNDIPVTQESFVSELADLHVNFFAAPIAARAALLHDYLFTNDKEESNRTIGKILNAVIGKSRRNVQAIRVSHIGRFLDPYRDRIDSVVGALQEKVRDSKDWETLSPQRRARRLLGELSRLPEARELGAVIMAQGIYRAPVHGLRVVRRYMRSQLVRTGIGRELSQEDLAHLCVRGYLNAVDRDEAQLLAAALLVASTERATGDALGIGKTLNIVLSNMGPAGAKMLQAIHSHPSTAEPIRKELKRSKVQHDEPYRFNVVGWAEDAGLTNPENPHRAAYLGPVKGSGAFGVTMFNTDLQGNTVADTLLRPRAAEKAEREFKLIAKAGETVVRRDLRMTPVLGMIEEATRSSRIETQMALAVKQNTIAEQVYDGIKVSITDESGSHEFKHRVMRLLHHGPTHKRAEVAQGTHFNDLAEDTPLTLDAATSMLSIQLLARFAGLPVDRDRHGGNIKVEGNTIQHYDFGAMEAVLPTPLEKRTLGKVVAQAIKDVGLHGGDFTSYVISRINALPSNDESKPFLDGFTREMLAMGDYRNAGVSEGTLKGILGLALYGKTADRDILKGFKSELGALFEPKARRELESAAAKCGIKVTGLKRASEIIMPDLSNDERALFGVSADGTKAHMPHLLAYLRSASRRHQLGE